MAAVNRISKIVMGVFSRPALSRRERLRRRAMVLLSRRDKAYLEAFDIAEAYPECLSDINRGIDDAIFATGSKVKESTQKTTVELVVYDDGGSPIPVTPEYICHLVREDYRRQNKLNHLGDLHINTQAFEAEASTDPPSS